MFARVAGVFVGSQLLGMCVDAMLDLVLSTVRHASVFDTQMICASTWLIRVC